MKHKRFLFTLQCLLALNVWAGEKPHESLSRVPSTMNWANIDVITYRAGNKDFTNAASFYTFVFIQGLRTTTNGIITPSSKASARDIMTPNGKKFSMHAANLHDRIYRLRIEFGRWASFSTLRQHHLMLIRITASHFDGNSFLVNNVTTSVNTLFVGKFN